MLYNIEDYVYDSGLQVLYGQRSNIPKCETINNEYLSEISFLKKQKSTSFSRKTVQKAGIVLTANCNLRCNYCSQCSEEGQEEKISMSSIKVFIDDILKKSIIASIIDDSEAVLSVTFTGGGEPTYRWTLLKESVMYLVGACEKNHVKLELQINTNGVFSREQADFIVKHFKKIMISYDGHPFMQNKNRQFSNQQRSSEIVEENIRYLSSLNPAVMIRTTIWQEDFDYLQKAADYIISNFPNVYSWDINPVTPAGRAVDVFKSRGRAIDKDFLGVYISLCEHIKSRKQNLQIFSSLFSHHHIGFSCGAVTPYTRRLWLMPDGSIITCADSSEIRTEVGHINDSTLVYYESYEDRLLDQGIKQSKACKDCIALGVCGGGCPIKHIREEQDRTGMVAWECEMQRQYWTYVLKELIKKREFDNVYLCSIGDETLEMYQIKWREVK